MKKDIKTNSPKFQDLDWSPKMTIKQFNDNKAYFFGVMHKSVKLDAGYKIVSTATKDKITYVIIEHPIVGDEKVKALVKHQEEKAAKVVIIPDKKVAKAKKVKKVKISKKPVKKVIKKKPVKKVKKKVVKKVVKKKVIKKKPIKKITKKKIKKGKGKR